MGAQNGSRLLVWWRGLLIHASELKLCHFECSHMFVQEAMHLQCLPINYFTGTRYVNDPLPNKLYIAAWMPTCIVWLYYAHTYTLQQFMDHGRYLDYFFSRFMGLWGALGGIPSFAVLHTEKQAFQCATLLSRACRSNSAKPGIGYESTCTMWWFPDN